MEPNAFCDHFLFSFPAAETLNDEPSRVGEFVSIEKQIHKVDSVGAAGEREGWRWDWTN